MFGACAGAVTGARVQRERRVAGRIGERAAVVVVARVALRRARVVRRALEARRARRGRRAVAVEHARVPVLLTARGADGRLGIGAGTGAIVRARTGAFFSLAAKDEQR